MIEKIKRNETRNREDKMENKDEILCTLKYCFVSFAKCYSINGLSSLGKVSLSEKLATILSQTSSNNQSSIVRKCDVRN